LHWPESKKFNTDTQAMTFSAFHTKNICSFFIKTTSEITIGLLCFVFCSIFFVACSYLSNPLRKETKLLLAGKIIDTTSYVYDLPYPQGISHLMVQGYFSNFTHKRRAALDFKMPEGSTLCAARGGVVVRMKDDGEDGGSDKAFRQQANYVIIQHADSSRAGYWHLKRKGVLVHVGDTVQKGQPIAVSGNTGYTFFPHLHFIVWSFDIKGKWKQLPTRFFTKDGPKYLVAITSYENPVH
jgi:murein DD-endopeptidase MepM/ murein hydrolase activator NlpD